MEIRTEPVTVYESDNRLYTIGNAFALRITSLYGVPPFEIEDGVLRIDANETKGELLSPFDFEETELSKVGEQIDIPLVVDDGEIKFVVAYFDNFPAYSPYYGVTEDGTVYEIENDFVVPENPFTEGDELLGIPDRDEHCITIKNLERDWAAPVASEKVDQWFDQGRLNATFQIHS